MGNDLQSGYIDRKPIKNLTHNNTCDYCDYRDVCANSKMIFNKVSEQQSDSEVIENLYKEFETNAKVDTTTE